MQCSDQIRAGTQENQTLREIDSECCDSRIDRLDPIVKITLHPSSVCHPQRSTALTHLPEFASHRPPNLFFIAVIGAGGLVSPLRMREGGRDRVVVLSWAWHLRKAGKLGRRPQRLAKNARSTDPICGVRVCGPRHSSPKHPGPELKGASKCYPPANSSVSSP